MPVVEGWRRRGHDLPPALRRRAGWYRGARDDRADLYLVHRPQPDLADHRAGLRRALSRSASSQSYFTTQRSYETRWRRSEQSVIDNHDRVMHMDCSYIFD